jgi:type IV pilus assembly protein PilM
MNSGNFFRYGIYKSALVRRIALWLDEMPHPMIACEIGANSVAAARWTRAGLESYAVDALPPGAIVPSAAESNIMHADEVRASVGRVFERLRVKKEEDVALIVPDAVIRVFVLHFDVFPRAPEEALPLLRWRLKKSVPFEADETLISYMRQAPKEDGIDVVTGLARLRIIREYESLIESVGLLPGMVISSTLAALPLLPDDRPSLLARVEGSTLTTVILRGGILTGYRCISLPADAAEVSPQAVLDEIYPLTAYYQDTWGEGIGQVRLSGLEGRTEEFRGTFESELQCPVSSLLAAAAAAGKIRASDQPLVERGLDALIGWPLNQGA